MRLPAGARHTSQHHTTSTDNRLETQLGAAPVSALCIVSAQMTKERSKHHITKSFKKRYLPDSVARSHADPVRNGSVLLHLDSQCALGAEALLRRL